jgi:hypothetical protein
LSSDYIFGAVVGVAIATLPALIALYRYFGAFRSRIEFELRLDGFAKMRAEEPPEYRDRTIRALLIQLLSESPNERAQREREQGGSE